MTDISGKNKNISNIAIEESMKSSYIDYAMSVIVGRSLPDVRDGLKPVHRRVLYAMKQIKNTWNQPHKKCARIVGETIGKYHPHGDQAAYDTLVRMAQDFSMRYCLVDGQGNFGSIDGDSAAAMRYTEARMKKISEEMLTDIDKDTVNMIDNYDGSLKEPVVFPTKIPQLLINGTSGIAVGMASNIPSHNLREVIDAAIHLIDNPEASVLELMEHIPGPDFPTSGIILGRSGIRKAYETGKGSIKIRSKTEIETLKNNSEQIVITELPYQVNKANLIIKIAELVKLKKLEGIRDIRDESDRHGIRVVIEIKNNYAAEIVLNKLYKTTNVQTSFGVNMLAICHGVPRVLTLRDTLEYFVIHRKDVVTRRTKYELREAEKRLHILEGYKIALDNIDEVIELIKTSSSTAEAKKRLMDRFSFSIPQASSILEMKLQKLTGMERDKILEQYKETLEKIAWFKEILANENTLKNVIKEELEEIKENYGDERRTSIENYDGEIDMEDIIPDDDMVVTLTKENYIKRTPLDMYRTQKRGGKGISAITPKDQDFVNQIFIASNHAMLLIFTSYGKVYWSKVYEIPKAGRNSRGKPFINFIRIEKDEKVASILPVSEFVDDHYVMMATEKGTIKKVEMSQFSKRRSGGKRAIKLKEDDRLISARITNGENEVVLSSLRGLGIRFREKDVRSMGRAASGVRGIKLDKGNEVKSMEIITPEDTLLSITSKGIGKRTKAEAFRLQSRGGKGIITIKTSDKNGYVVGTRKVSDKDEVMLITSTGQAIRIPADGISVIGRNTKGVRLFRVASGEKVVSVTIIKDPAEEN